MTEITGAITSLFGVMTSVVTAITGNTVLVLFLSASVIGIGVGIFRKLKG